MARKRTNRGRALTLKVELWAAHPTSRLHTFALCSIADSGYIVSNDVYKA